MRKYDNWYSVYNLAGQKFNYPVTLATLHKTCYEILYKIRYICFMDMTHRA